MTFWDVFATYILIGMFIYAIALVELQPGQWHDFNPIPTMIIAAFVVLMWPVVLRMVFKKK